MIVLWGRVTLYHRARQACCIYDCLPPNADRVSSSVVNLIRRLETVSSAGSGSGRIANLFMAPGREEL